MTALPNLFRTFALAGALAVLASCGGGGGGASGKPAVTTMQASGARFAGTSIIGISGSNLRSGIQVVVEGACANAKSLATGTDDFQQYSCEVQGIGEFVARVLGDGDREIGRLTVNVPQPEVTVVTSKGTITLQLDPVAAPLSVRNFLAYVNAVPSFYQGVLFHRVIKDKGILTGGYTTGLAAKAATRAAIALESKNGLKNVRGAVGVGRTGGPDSGTSQWYINLGSNPELDFVDDSNPGYAVFGKVTAGLDVADTIAGVETRPDLLRGLGDVPVAEILITSASQTR